MFLKTLLIRFLLLLLAALPVGGSLQAADEPPARPALGQQARRCRQILVTSLVDFYLPGCVDRVNGAYLEALRDGSLP